MSFRDIVVVGVTKMGPVACVGALDCETGASYRLVRRDGHSPFEANTDLRPGAVLSVELLGPARQDPPHVEDVAIGRYRQTGLMEPLALARFVLGTSQAPIWRGGYERLFNGTLKQHKGLTVALRRGGSLPGCSTGFWIPSHPLVRSGEDRFLLQQDNVPLFEVKSVALEPIQEHTLPAGSLLRVSLARWFKPAAKVPEACWLQLSGMIHPGFGYRERSE